MIEEKGRDLLAFRGLFLSALMKQLKILVYLGAVMVLCQILVLFPLVFAPNAGAEVDETLRSRIEEVGACPTIAVEEEMVYASMALPRFYERRGYRLAWSQGGDLLPQVSSLIHALREAHRNGLRPDDYHVGTITALVDKLNENGIPSSKTSQLVDLDLLLTDAFLVYASHLL
ncbi:MAG: hypothetical protein JXD19_03070, partial [Deltaproteobacteria bacterium]|nr:hypothetical protein [Deltaproteobacteria bacterium]